MFLKNWTSCLDLQTLSSSTHANVDGIKQGEREEKDESKIAQNMVNRFEHRKVNNTKYNTSCITYLVTYNCNTIPQFA